MTKTFEQLKLDADIEEFVSETKLKDAPAKKTRTRKSHVIVPTQEQIDAAPLRPAKIAYGAKVPKEISAKDIESKGEFVSLGTVEEIAKKEDKQESAEIRYMWTSASEKLGDPIKFVGSPFEKAKKEKASEEEAKEWLEQALEILEQLNLDQDYAKESEEVKEESHIEQAHLQEK